MAWVLDDLVPGLDDRATDGVALTLVPVTVTRPESRSISTLRTPGTSASSSRTESTQCEHVIPATMYSRASLIAVVSNRIRAGGIGDQGTKPNRARQIPPTGIYADRISR